MTHVPSDSRLAALDLPTEGAQRNRILGTLKLEDTRRHLAEAELYIEENEEKYEADVEKMKNCAQARRCLPGGLGRGCDGESTGSAALFRRPGISAS